MTREQRNKAIQRLELLELRLDGLSALSYNVSDANLKSFNTISKVKLGFLLKYL